MTNRKERQSLELSVLGSLVAESVSDIVGIA